VKLLGKQVDILQNSLNIQGDERKRSSDLIEHLKRLIEVLRTRPVPPAPPPEKLISARLTFLTRNDDKEGGTVRVSFLSRGAEVWSTTLAEAR
jgi:hypothetical protein